MRNIKSNLHIECSIYTLLKWPPSGRKLQVNKTWKKERSTEDPSLNEEKKPRSAAQVVVRVGAPGGCSRRHAAAQNRRARGHGGLRLRLARDGRRDDHDDAADAAVEPAGDDRAGGRGAQRAVWRG